MEYLFHEIQDGSLCAQHCLNSLLQGDFFTAVDLAQIAEQLDKQERIHMSEAGTLTKDYERFLGQDSSNYDDSGFFSIQVLQKALGAFSLDLIPYSSQNPLAIQARENPTSLKAFVCNFKEHWYTIRKIGNYWFNLNSMFKSPELISETYLSILLAQLVNDGYSIFIVDGDLPRNSQAEMKLLEKPLDQKEILSGYSKRMKKSHQSNTNDFDDDDDLKSAIKMSLLENDMDLDNKAGRSNIQYPSLATDMQHSQDDDLKRAIELSLAANDKSEQDTKKDLTAEELREKRLKMFENKTKKEVKKVEIVQSTSENEDGTKDEKSDSKDDVKMTECSEKMDEEQNENKSTPEKQINTENESNQISS